MTNQTVVNISCKVLFRSKNKILTPGLRGILVNLLMQPRFDRICSAWYGNLTQKTKEEYSNRTS